jgi:hypothetical protein
MLNPSLVTVTGEKYKIMDPVTTTTILVILAGVSLAIYLYGRSRARRVESGRGSVRGGPRTRDDPHVRDQSPVIHGQAEYAAPEQASQASLAGNPAGRDLKTERMEEREREREAYQSKEAYSQDRPARRDEESG